MSSANAPIPIAGSEPRRNPRYLADGVMVLIILSLAILTVSCSGNPPEVTPSAEAGLEFTIQRLSPAVFLGEIDPLPEVSVDDVQPFPINFLATTSQEGEAVIKAQIEGASCSIFLFFDTRLERSACNRSASQGNTTCLEEGSAVFENCHNHVVQTASGEVTLLGTWASVTYLPDQKLTLLAVTEGEASVQPVLEETTRTMGGPIEVGAGEYYYTAPDQAIQPVPGVPARQAAPLYEIGPMLVQYPQTFDWVTRAMDRSREYGVDPARFEPPPTETATLTLVSPLTPTETQTPVYTSTPTDTPIVTITPAFAPPPTAAPPNLLVVPALGQANPPAVDGDCQDRAYGQAYSGSFEVGRQARAEIHLLQDSDWLYVCVSYPAGFPASGRVSVRLDPQGDGNLYPWNDLSDIWLSLEAQTGRNQTFFRPGSGGYVATDRYSQDWYAAINRGRELELMGVEYAIGIEKFALGNCGRVFSLTFFNSEIPFIPQIYGWPDGMDPNPPESWQKAVLAQPFCPAQPQGRIAFTCQLDQRETNQQICMVDSYGSGYRQLTYDSGFRHAFPSFAPDGRSLVYVADRTGAFEIYELDLESLQETQLTEDLGDLAAPAISPQGDRIVFTNRSDYPDKPYTGNGVWIMGRSGERPRRLVGLPWGYAWDPVWSPDGEQILFASNREGDIQLYIVNADGGIPVRLNRIESLRGRSDWSSAGQIATYAGESWKREILVMNADGTDVQTITEGGNNLAPSFSPDGEWIAFTSYRDHYEDEQGCEIYIMRRDGSDVRRLTDNDYCDYQPRWGPPVESGEFR
jgi:TolB protein